MGTQSEDAVKRLDKLGRLLTYAAVILAASVVLLLILDFT